MRLLLLLSVILLSCESQKRRSISESYHGSDLNLDYYKSHCSQETLEQVCENELQETLAFKKSCLLQKRKVVQCDCDEYLCVDKEDHLISSLNDIHEPETIEPELLPPPPELEKPERGKFLGDHTKQYTGIDFNGDMRACSPLPPGYGCLAVFSKKDEYAFQCRDEGYDVVYCGCDDPICLK